VADLQGKVALVTGTAHGIGSAIADGLETDGATVHRADRDTVDLADAKQVASLLDTIGPIDLLVNNAGGVSGQVGKPLEEVTEDEWHAVLDANLTTAFLCTKAAVWGMKDSGFGRIVIISSGAAQVAFTRQMAHELGPYGITVNCIAPGFVLSNPTTQAQWDSYGEQGQRKLTEQIALRRLGSAEDIANGVRFLVSAQASWITGHLLAIDGGHTAL
jgi:3-oxoacyl-[acyl-carrier protein] reductase